MLIELKFPANLNYIVRVRAEEMTQKLIPKHGPSSRMTV